jgi:hypothetical protein
MQPDNTRPESAPESADETPPRIRLAPVHLPADADDEPMGGDPIGGDPPCWAHLFDDEDDPPR